MPIKLSHERSTIFKELHARAVERISVINLTSPALAARGHESWVWDASTMPAGGHYYPIFIAIIEQLERYEGMRPDAHVLVETTTGTAGIALGHIAKQLGYDIILFAPEDLPKRRIQAIEALLPSSRSEIRFTPAGQYAQGMVRAFQQFLVERRAATSRANRIHEGQKELVALDHSRRPIAITALMQLLSVAFEKVAAVQFGYVVAALGNGTSSGALFKAARRMYPRIRRIGVEPLEAPTAFVGKFGASAFASRFGSPPQFKPHELFGTGGWGVSCPHLDLSEIDDIILSESVDWHAAQISLARRGLELGNSTAACQAAIEAISAEQKDGQRNFFSTIYDRAELY